MMRGYGYGYGSGPLMHGLGPGFGLLIALFWLLVIAGLAVLIVWLVRRQGHVTHAAATTVGAPLAMGLPPTAGPHDEALAAAAKRYAGGEITREQYEEIRDTIRGGAQKPPTEEPSS